MEGVAIIAGAETPYSEKHHRPTALALPFANAALAGLMRQPIARNLEIEVVGRRHEPEAESEASNPFHSLRVDRDS